MATLLEQVQDIIHTPDRFEAWLNNKEKSASVGIAMRDVDCPLATFLKETFTDPTTNFDFAVYQDTMNVYHRDMNGDCIRVDRTFTPRWADKFICQLDTPNYRYPVSAEQALNTLRESLDRIV